MIYVQQPYKGVGDMRMRLCHPGREGLRAERIIYVQQPYNGLGNMRMSNCYEGLHLWREGLRAERQLASVSHWCVRWFVLGAGLGVCFMVFKCPGLFAQSLHVYSSTVQKTRLRLELDRQFPWPCTWTFCCLHPFPPLLSSFSPPVQGISQRPFTFQGFYPVTLFLTPCLPPFFISFPPSPFVRLWHCDFP